MLWNRNIQLPNTSPYHNTEHKSLRTCCIRSCNDFSFSSDALLLADSRAILAFREMAVFAPAACGSIIIIIVTRQTTNTNAYTERVLSSAQVDHPSSHHPTPPHPTTAPAKKAKPNSTQQNTNTQTKSSHARRQSVSRNQSNPRNVQCASAFSENIIRRFAPSLPNKQQSISKKPHPASPSSPSRGWNIAP